MQTVDVWLNMNQLRRQHGKSSTLLRWSFWMSLVNSSRFFLFLSLLPLQFALITYLVEGLCLKIGQLPQKVMYIIDVEHRQEFLSTRVQKCITHFWLRHRLEDTAVGGTHCSLPLHYVRLTLLWKSGVGPDPWIPKSSYVPDWCR